MPTSFIDPAAGYDSAPLNAAEIDRVREICREPGPTYSGISYQFAALQFFTDRCGNLTASQNQATRYDLDQFFNQVGEGTVETNGNQDGVKFSQTRDRNTIRTRLRDRLALPAYASGAAMVRG